MTTLPELIALDLEATGGGKDDDIMEVGAVRFAGERILDTFQTLVRPRRPPSLRVQQLTGLTPAGLAKAPYFEDVRLRLRDFVGDTPLVAHSVDIDKERLQRQGLPLANRGYDTYELAGVLLPGLPAYGLAPVAEALGVEVDEQHRALPDAITNQRVFLQLFERLLALDPRVLLQVEHLLAQSDWPLRDLFHEAAQVASKAALARAIAGRALDPDLPIVQRSAEATPLEAAGPPRPLDTAALARVWSPDGPLARRFPGYEERPQQAQLSAAIAQTFNDGGRLIAEAGTGTGKTLAYLVPAAQWAVQYGERVVVSTNTVNLQDQIQQKDVPDLQQALGKRFKVHVLKGRGNYLCMLRWADFRTRRPEGGRLSALESRVIVKVLLWLRESTTGDVADLGLSGDEQLLWKEISATQDTCINDACHFKHQRQCYLFNARRAAEAAHLVIVNHALLLSDLATESVVLPEYEHLILDEAHHLEEQATKHLGYDLTRRDLFRLFADLYQGNDPQRLAGLLPEVRHLLQLAEAVGARAIRRVGEAEEAVRRAGDAAGRFFVAVTRALESLESAEHRGRAYGARPARAYERHTRITAAVREHRAWPGVVTAWKDLGVVLTELQSHLEHLAQDLDALQGQARENVERQAQVLLSLLRRLTQTRVELEALVAEPDEERVYWISHSDQTESISLHSAPIHVGKLLDELLYTPRRTVVLTSATLTVDWRFDYMRERLGLLDGVQTLQIGSPFHYERQALVYLPRSLAEPTAPMYQEQVNKALIDFATASRGRCLVLFTSHAALQEATRGIRQELEDQGIIVAAQGTDGSRNQLVQLLRSNQAAVVLGSTSFWEGVDVAGEALSALAIVKLPFTVPSDPVFAARSEQFQRPFDQYAVPQAVLRFKQGFGRLIRTATDRGVLLVLDPRVTTKYYGAQFLRSLPACSKQQGPLADVGPVTARWLGATHEPLTGVDG